MKPHLAPPIYLIRGRQVILNSDLAALFGVTTKRFNEQIRRNFHRFPSDFAFILTSTESESLRSQTATSKIHGGRRQLPFVFTEHGVIMAANVLNSPRANAMSVQVVRAFVRLRQLAQVDAGLRDKISELERSVRGRLDGHDADIERLFRAVEALLKSPGGLVKRIGFVP